MQMRTGDLFVVKPGCGDEGKVGILIGRPGWEPRADKPWGVQGGFLYTVLLEGVRRAVNGYFIQPLGGEQ